MDELLKKLELSYSVYEIDSFMSLIGTMRGANVEPKYMYLARVLSDMGSVYYAPEILSAPLNPRGREFYKAGGFLTVAKTRKKIYRFNVRVVGTRDSIVALAVALASATLSTLISIALSLHFVARSQYKESQSVNQVQNSQQLEQSYLKILIQFISTHNV